jgi:hypothetical protein
MMQKIKRFEDWKGNLRDFLEIDDLVDDEIYEHFINVLPPACMTSQVVQIGEPSSVSEGMDTFETLKNSPEGWRYAGRCHRGQTVSK